MTHYMHNSDSINAAPRPGSFTAENLGTMTTTTPIRVMIVDDHAVIRSGLRMLIEQDQTMSVVSMAGSRVEAINNAQIASPDIIVFDLLLGEEDGLSFLPDLELELRVCEDARSFSL